MTPRYPMPFLFPLLLASLLGACGTAQRPATVALDDGLIETLPASCSTELARFRAAVDFDGVNLASTPPLPHFPLFHSDRFLHELSRSVDSPAEAAAWSALAAERGIEARAAENRNLNSPFDASALERLAACAMSFSNENAYADARADLLQSLSAREYPDHYSRAKQNFGGLVVLRPFLERRIRAEHGEERERFLAANDFPNSSFYESAEPRSELADSAAWLSRAYDSSVLTLPLLQQDQLAALIQQHAPSLHIERLGDNDLIGAPGWQAAKLRIDTDRPVLYTLPTMTRFEGRNLLQLNYVFWFPERRPEGLLDIYAGKVDSIIWRVTLAEDGGVLLYDSIHSCGCYHKYFMVSDAIAEKAQPASKEPANVFRLDGAALEDGVVIEINANAHYIVGVEPLSSYSDRSRQLGTQSYTLAPYTDLYNLPSENGSQSLFDARGLIAGSERLERFTLWPTGILSVGAMRQWGTHATGFIEEQHFDDATLFEDYFEFQP